MAEGKDNHAVTIATLGAKVEALAGDVSEIKQSQTTLTVAQAKLTASVEGLTAEVKSLIRRDQHDIQKLFELDGERSNRIAKIEREYVPEKQLQGHIATDSKEHDAMQSKISGLDSKVNKGVGMIVILNAIVFVLLKAFWK